MHLPPCPSTFVARSRLSFSGVERVLMYRLSLLGKKACEDRVANLDEDRRRLHEVPDLRYQPGRARSRRQIRFNFHRRIYGLSLISECSCNFPELGRRLTQVRGDRFRNRRLHRESADQSSDPWLDLRAQLSSFCRTGEEEGNCGKCFPRSGQNVGDFVR